MERTIDGLATPRPRAARRISRWWSLPPTVLLLAVLAFLLLPTGQANFHHLVQINGLTLAISPTATLSQVAGDSLALTHAGSELDLTGDVIGMGQGSLGQMTLHGIPLTPDTLLNDGAIVVIAHGAHHLEGISKKKQTLPYETIMEGKGAVVTLVQKGIPGEREIYRGDRSGKQAALFTLADPQNALVRRSSTAGSGQKLVALTFDDGPGKYTQGVLDALAAKNVPATFFVLGGNAAANPGMMKKIRAAGHQVENHTWGHPVLTKTSDDKIRSEIKRTSDVLGGTRYLRPPYGAYDSRVAAIAGEMGHRLVMWTVDTLDWKNRNADAMLQHVKRDTRPGGIILLHDGGIDRSQTVAAIPRIVDWLFANGYSLTTVARLLEG